MELKGQFEDWAKFTEGKYSDRQWLLAKWEVSDGVVWPEEKVAVMLKTIRERLGLQPAHSFADLGCGGGWILAKLAPYVRTAVGLDFSWNMLQNAFGLVPKESLMQGAIGSLPIKDESFDRVLCYFVLINMLDDQEVERSILDMVRIVRKGGKLLVGQLPDKAGSPAYDCAKTEYLEFCHQHYSEGNSLRERNRVPQKLFDVPALEAFLKRASLRYKIHPSFNPFYRPGAAETVDWRFDLVVFKD